MTTPPRQNPYLALALPVALLAGALTIGFWTLDHIRVARAAPSPPRCGCSPERIPQKRLPGSRKKSATEQGLRGQSVGLPTQARRGVRPKSGAAKKGTALRRRRP